MRQLKKWLVGDVRLELESLSREQAETTRALAEVVKGLLAVNQSLAKLLLKKAEEPEELTNVERAALLGLPAAMADLVDWEQVKGGRGR